MNVVVADVVVFTVVVSEWRSNVRSEQCGSVITSSKWNVSGLVVNAGRTQTGLNCKLRNGSRYRCSAVCCLCCRVDTVVAVTVTNVVVIAYIVVVDVVTITVFVDKW